MSLRVFVVTVLSFLISCSPHNPYTRSYLSDRVKAQSDFDIIQKKEAGKFDVPPGVDLGNGITEDEADRLLQNANRLELWQLCNLSNGLA